MRIIYVVLGSSCDSGEHIETFTSKEKAYALCEKLNKQLIEDNPNSITEDGNLDGHTMYDVYHSVLNRQIKKRT